MKLSLRMHLTSCAMLCVIINAGCAPVRSNSQTEAFTEKQEYPHEPMPIVSNISEMNQPQWKVSALEGNNHQDLETIHVLDETHMWVGGKRAMYKTSNGGQSWETVKLDIPPNSKVADLVFSHTLGWAVLQQSAPDLAKFQENQVQLMRTSDEGRSWQLQYFNKPVVITRIAFVNEQEGWLVGLKYTGSRPFDTALLVLHTTNQGKDWADVSENLNAVAINDKGFVIGRVESVFTEGPLTATVLTSRGQMFKTDNGGQSWQQINDKRKDFLSPMSACCLGFKTDKLRWIAGGQFGEEGTRSLLTVEQPNGLWQKYYLRDVYLRDVLYLSEKQIFACGSSFPKGSRKSFTPTDAVILSSSDGGHSWSVIYRNSQIESINALAGVNSQHVWAVGNDGLILRIEHIIRGSLIGRPVQRLVRLRR